MTFSNPVSVDARRRRPAARPLGDFSPFRLTGTNGYFHGWASDPTVLAYGNGGSVDAWRDASGTGDVTNTGTGRPTLVAADPTCNYRPALDFDHTLNQRLSRAAGTLNQAFTVMAVARTDNDAGPSGQVVFDGNSGSNAFGGIYRGSTDDYSMYSGVVLFGGSPDTSLHLFEWYFSGGAFVSTITVDGAVVAGPANAGLAAMTGFRVGDVLAGGAPLNGRVCWLYAFSGAGSSLSYYSALRRGLARYYNLAGTY